MNCNLDALRFLAYVTQSTISQHLGICQSTYSRYEHSIHINVHSRNKIIRTLHTSTSFIQALTMHALAYPDDNQCNEIPERQY